MQTKLSPKETAIIVLDVQNDFCSSEGAFKKVLGRDTAAIQKMVQRLKVFIDDARKQGCKIIFSKMVNSPDSPANLRERLTFGAESKAAQWPFALEQGSWGGELYEIVPSEDDAIIEKVYFDLFSSPKFKDKLEELGIKNLVISGVYEEMCVLSTASRGLTEGYHVVISKDLVETAPENKKHKEMINELLAGYIAEVLESPEIMAELKNKR
jgi:ureidoacrylate peracid hydrolase